MKSNTLKAIGILVITAGITYCFVLWQESKEFQNTSITDYKDSTYYIDGEAIRLVDGYHESSMDGSSAKTITRYFGNELVTDLDADGDDDVAFVVTQETGGSGLFYYAVAAIKTTNGYVGSDGYFLGDRISPQSTVVSSNPRHKNVVVFNFADRAPNEPMSASPSVGKSSYLKIDSENSRWGIVEADFEGESNR